MFSFLLKIIKNISCRSSCQLDINKKEIFKFISKLDHNEFKSLIEIHEMKIDLLKENNNLLNDEIDNIIKNSLKKSFKKKYTVSQI